MAWCSQATAISWTNVDPDLCWLKASLGYNELRKCRLNLSFFFFQDLDFDRYIDEDKIIFCAMKNGISIDWMKNIFKIIEPSEVTDKVSLSNKLFFVENKTGMLC